MTVLLVGAIYWVWTQIQYVQRKVNVLENGVYELKTLCQKLQTPDPVPVHYPPAPSSVMGEDEDLLHETLHSEETAPEQEDETIAENSVTPEPIIPAMFDEQHATELPDPNTTQDELMPGGTAFGIPELAAHSTALDTLSLKELRRLGEQHGISGIKEMKRKELIAAIRQKPAINFFGTNE